MGIADRKRLKTREEYLEAQQEADMLWDSPDDSRINRLIELILRYERDHADEPTCHDLLVPPRHGQGSLR